MLNTSMKSLGFGITLATFIVTSTSAQISQNEVFTHSKKDNNHRQIPPIEVDSFVESSSLIVAQNSIEVARIRTDIITRIIKGIFKGTKVYLHNRGSKMGDSWHQKNASYIQLSQTLGGRKQSFNLPESKINASAYGTLRYYVDSIKLSKLDVTKQDDAFKLSLFFESSGTELKGYHTGRFVDFGDRGAPDIQMDNIRLDVFLTPTQDDRGRLSYSKINVKFDADIQAGGVCNIRGTDICNKMFKYKKRIAEAIENNLRDQLNNQRTRDRLAAALQSQLRKFGISKIVGVDFQGNNLVIRHRS